jgi:hypothetical protein
MVAAVTAAMVATNMPPSWYAAIQATAAMVAAMTAANHDGRQS